MLQKDLQEDLRRLQNGSRYFISDTGNPSPSLQSLTEDLQFFQLVADLDLSKADYSSQQRGNHIIRSWRLPDGDIKVIYQIESPVHLDTVVTQRYLEQRAPTQHRITNDFTFRTYAVSSSTTPLKLFYLTEADQGLLAYQLNDRQVQVNYTGKKEGLSDILPQYKEEVTQLLKTLQRQERHYIQE